MGIGVASPGARPTPRAEWGEWGGRVPDRLAQLEKHPFGGGCVWRQTS